MGKSFLILVGVGALFAYFVYNFVGSIEDNDSSSYSINEQKAKEFAKYYKKDEVGDYILDLTGVPLSTAKKVWVESPVKKEIMKNFPNFEMMHELAIEKIKACKFRDFLLKRLERVQSDFLPGSISSEEAAKLLNDL
jgi:hypothetical protein